MYKRVRKSSNSRKFIDWEIYKYCLCIIFNRDCRKFICIYLYFKILKIYLYFTKQIGAYAEHHLLLKPENETRSS